jgi:hypothetical protein
LSMYPMILTAAGIRHPAIGTANIGRTSLF